MAIKRKYNQISLGIKQYLTLIQSSINLHPSKSLLSNPPSIILHESTESVLI